MATGLSFAAQADAIKKLIHCKKVAITDNFGYEGLQPMFESIARCDGFFNIVSAKPRSIIRREVARFYCSLNAADEDPAVVTFMLQTEGEPKRTLRVLPLVLQSYNLADTGSICKINDIPIEAVHRLYQRAINEPEKSFGETTNNRSLLKHEYRILFKFVHNGFLSYACSNESVFVPKLRVMEELDVNWARLLINLFIEQSKFIVRSLVKDRVVKIESKQILHHGMKISFMLQSLLPNRAWMGAEAIPEKRLVPHSQLQLEILLGVTSKERGGERIDYPPASEMLQLYVSLNL